MSITMECGRGFKGATDTYLHVIRRKMLLVVVGHYMFLKNIYISMCIVKYEHRIENTYVDVYLVFLSLD